jgi:hypothetical protein
VATKLGLSGDGLAAGLARALERHGTLEAARRESERAVNDLLAEHGRLRATVAELRSRRERLTAAIAGVRDAGIAQVEATAGAARQPVAAVAARFQALSAEAARLEREVTFARALASRDRGAWSEVAPDAWVGLLRCLEVWAETNRVNPEVPLPDAVRREAKGIREYSALDGPARVPLRGLATWLAHGLLQTRPLASALRGLAPGGHP